jgi:hypothetical protein
MAKRMHHRGTRKPGRFRSHILWNSGRDHGACAYVAGEKNKGIERKVSLNRKRDWRFEDGGGDLGNGRRSNSPKELQAIRQQGGDRPCLIGFRACALTAHPRLTLTLTYSPLALLSLYCRSNLQVSAMRPEFFNPLIYT